MRRSITLLLLSAILLVSAGASRAANTTTLHLGPAAAINATIATADEVDSYRLDVVADRTYIIETFDVSVGSGDGTAIALY